MKPATASTPTTRRGAARACLSLVSLVVAAAVVAPMRGAIAYAPSSSSFVPSPFTFASYRRSSHAALGAAAAASSSSSSSSSAMRMDLERPETTLATARWQLEQLLLRESSSTTTTRGVDEEQARHGMPWMTSIDPAYKDDELLYMKFWEWQVQFMKENLTNLKVEDCSNGSTNFAYRDNAQKKARIVSMCLSSDEYRKIRLTYYDAGDGAQVFNAVFYPDARYNLPVLGVDVLAFNRKKYLAIVDFQPLHHDEAMHASTYEHLLKPIKDRYDSLKGQMSSKFYDETQFFSKQMLFSRFEDERIIEDELFPAFQKYVQTHLQLVRDTPADPDGAQRVMERQEAYDKYSAERDPATGLFSAMFGTEWAQDFVHDFLFSLSRRGAASLTEAEAAETLVSAPQPRHAEALKTPAVAAPAPPAVPEAAAPRVGQPAFVQQRRR